MASRAARTRPTWRQRRAPCSRPATPCCDSTCAAPGRRGRYARTSMMRDAARTSPTPSRPCLPRLSARGRRSSAARFLPAVRVPTLVIHALDDPWIPSAGYLGFAWRVNSALVPLLPDHGGHLGFHWRDSAVPWHMRASVAFLDEVACAGRLV